MFLACFSYPWYRVSDGEVVSLLVLNCGVECHVEPGDCMFLMVYSDATVVRANIWPLLLWSSVHDDLAPGYGLRMACFPSSLTVLKSRGNGGLILDRSSNGGGISHHHALESRLVALSLLVVGAHALHLGNTR